MSYSRIKVWIAAEVLTASDLNNEHDGHITNENDLDSRLISEITTRSALETEHDTFYAACWNAGSSEIAANRVSNNSMKNDSVGFAELKSECNNPTSVTPGLRSLGLLGLTACAGNDQRLSDTRCVADFAAGNVLAGNDAYKAEANSISTSYEKVAEYSCPMAGALRIKFTLRGKGDGASVYGRIYKNGVAVGTERNHGNSATPVEYSEDISSWSAGNAIQLYCKTGDVGDPCYYSSFKIYTNKAYSFEVVEV
jgi:hypothetical protein